MTDFFSRVSDLERGSLFFPWMAVYLDREGIGRLRLAPSVGSKGFSGAVDSSFRIGVPSLVRLAKSRDLTAAAVLGLVVQISPICASLLALRRQSGAALRLYATVFPLVPQRAGTQAVHT